ncbi:tRNA uridine-5-carboxymethylaminomethyl(34) synthesis enzyme MnmG, partial [Acidithiobacillus sp. MC6.1]|nr:tRNA uridine-5-carboxymethylaminomethyl(34) synthesis enzyme MnmG [Acidithiobacillus sp. MC6.1]
PGSASAARIAAKTEQSLSRDVTALELLRRPDWDYVSLLNTLKLPLCTDAQAREQLEIECKYAGYVARQHDEITRAARWEGTDIPADMDYAAVRGLSTEVLQRLARQRPQTIGLASRIPGVTPAAISLLLIHVKRRGLQQAG